MLHPLLRIFAIVIALTLSATYIAYRQGAFDGMLASHPASPKGTEEVPLKFDLRA